MIWTEYDPTWIADAVRENYPEENELLNDIIKCTSCIVKNEKYTYFVDASNANRPGSKWQFVKSIEIRNTPCGHIKLDVLKGKKLGGIEFLNNVFID